MRYILQIHCEVPETYPAGSGKPKAFSKAFSKQRPQARNVTIEEFDGKESLYYFIRKYDYVNKHGIQGNHFLDATMTLPCDGLRHRFMDGRIYKCVGYYLTNGDGLTVDMRHHAGELYAFDKYSYHKKLRESWHFSIDWPEFHIELAADNAKDEKLLGRGYHHASGLRGFRTMQERRINCNDEHKPYIRGARRKLPEPWGTEIPVVLSKSWKDRRKSPERLIKYRRQWEAKMPRHMDTVRRKSRWERSYYRFGTRDGIFTKNGIPYYHCTLLNEDVDVGLCYDIQMIRHNSIKPEILN